MTIALLPAVSWAQATSESCPLGKGDHPTAPLADRNAIPEVHRSNVDCAFTTGITLGFPDGTFRPAQRVRRDQLASFLARTLDAAGVDLPPASDQGFLDTAANTHAQNINRLAAAGITQGTTSSTFDPALLVRRDQIASFLLRAVAHARGVPVETLQGGDAPFDDITENAHRGNIEGAFNFGLLSGTSAHTYTPAAPTRRDQMASFLINAVAALRADPDADPGRDAAPVPEPAADSDADPHPDPDSDEDDSGQTGGPGPVRDADPNPGTPPRPDPSAECTIVSGAAEIVGTEGNDVICVTGSPSQNHVVHALGGHDVVIGSLGVDTVHGGPGNDFLSATGEADTLIGDPGRDECVGVNADCEIVHRANELAAGVDLERVDDDVTDARSDPETGLIEVALRADAPVEVGDILNSGPTTELPKGLLGRVTAIEQEDSALRALVESVSLPEVIPFGEVQVVFDPAADVPVTEEVQGAQSRGEGMAAPSASTRSTFACGTSASAEVSATPTVSQSIQAGAGWIPFRPPAAYFDGSASVGAEASFRADAGAHCTWDRHLDGPNLGTKVVAVGPVVVVFTIESGIDLGFTASAEAYIEVEGTIDYGAEFLASLHDHNFNHGLFPINDASVEHRVDGELRARLDVTGKVSLEAYGAAGPALFMGGFVDAAARPLSDPWLTIDGGVVAGIDFVFDIWRIHEKYTVARRELIRFNITSESGAFPGPTITTESLPAGTVDEPYSVSLEATGGTTPLSWSARGPLPAGLQLDVDGTLSGTPETAGTYTITVTVTDSDNKSDAAHLTLRITGDDPPDDDPPPDGPSPGPRGGVAGDPHLATFDRLLYDMQAEGEFRFAESTDDAFAVHVRTRFIGGTAVSGVDEYAVRTPAGEVAIYDGSGVQVDGDPLADGEVRALADGGSVTADRLELGDGTTVTWNASPRARRVLVQLSAARGGHVTGLLGDANGTPDDDGMTSDGRQVMGPSALEGLDWEEIEAILYDDFAEGWLVEDSDRLFTDAQRPYVKPTGLVTFADFSDSEVDAARQTCVDNGWAEPELSFCAFDVLVTGDDAFADPEGIMGLPDDGTTSTGGEPRLDDAGDGTCTIQSTAVDTVLSGAECDALVAIYHATDGPNWRDNTGWDTATDPCAWTGVGCSSQGVASLSLQAQGLTGQLPPDITDLSHLAVLDLGRGSSRPTDPPNRATLPEEIGDLDELTVLAVDHNDLESIPATVGNLGSLEILNLRSNRLTVLPAEIGGLPHVVSLELGDNQLTDLPPEIGDLTSLTDLDLWNNQLTDLPAEIGGLTGLSWLDLASNNLTDLPPEIGDLTALAWLSLANNQLTDLPPEIGGLTSLASLDLWGNQLTDLPAKIGGLTNLSSLDLTANQLTDVPPEIADLSNLTWLSLGSNQLTAFPLAISDVTSLSGLDLWDNELTDLPPEIADLTKLTWLSLGGNQLSAFPLVISDLANLGGLDLASNQLTDVPPEIADLSNLYWLSLGGNQLGAFPPAISELANLSHLDLAANELADVPPEIADLTNLTWLSLGGNKLSAFPLPISDLANLAGLDLWGNQLTDLPPEIADLTNLTWLTLGGNQLSAFPLVISDLANLAGLDLWGNQLTDLPPEIGNLTNLTWLSLGHNELTALPAEIGQLTELVSLTLEGNELTALPAEVGQLVALEWLDVRHNRLSGDITAWALPFHDRLLQLSLNDGAEGNNCLTVTDAALAEWLSTVDPGWNRCD